MHDNGVYSLWYHFLGFLDVEVRQHGHELSTDNQRFMDSSSPVNFFVPLKPRLPVMIELACGGGGPVIGGLDAVKVSQQIVLNSPSKELCVDGFLPPLPTFTNTVMSTIEVRAVEEVKGYDVDNNKQGYPDLSGVFIGQDGSVDKQTVAAVGESYAFKARTRTMSDTGLTETTTGTSTRTSPFILPTNSNTAFSPTRTSTATATSTSLDHASSRNVVDGGGSSGQWSLSPVPQLLDKTVLEGDSAAVSDISDDEDGCADWHAMDEHRAGDNNEDDDDGYLRLAEWPALNATRRHSLSTDSSRDVEGHSDGSGSITPASAASSTLNDDAAKNIISFNWFEEMETLLVTSDEESDDEQKVGEGMSPVSRGQGRRGGREAGTEKALYRTRHMMSMSNHT